MLVEFDMIKDNAKLQEIREYVQNLVNEINYDIVDIWDATDHMSVNIWKDVGHIFFNVYTSENFTDVIAAGRIEEENYES